MMNNRKIIIAVALAVAVGVLGFGEGVWAETYFYYDAEGATVDDPIPQFPQPDGSPQFCETCWGDHGLGIVKNILDTPQGNRYWQWDIDANQTEASSVTTTVGTFPITVNNGETYYLACFSRFERIDGNDIWHEYSGGDSHDKYLVLYGHRDKFRHIVEFGQTACHEQNDDHHFTSWVNVGGDMHSPCFNTFPQNAGGYNSTNTLHLNYEQWYGVVMKVKISNSTEGELGLWINGIQILDYIEIKTVENYLGISINQIDIGGTLAQPAYDCPAHYRQQDALILTDSWQDIVDGGYLTDPEANNPPIRSNGQPTDTLASGTTSTNLSLTTNINATCRYTNISNTNYTNMTGTFTYTNSTSHSTQVTGLENGLTYTYFIRCNSSYGYVNDDDWNISFSVGGHKADLNDDGIIGMPELMIFIGRWKAGDGVSRQEVEEARDIWFIGGVY